MISKIQENFLDFRGCSWLQGWTSETPKKFQIESRMLKVLKQRIGCKIIIQLQDNQISRIMKRLKSSGYPLKTFLNKERCSWFKKTRSEIYSSDLSQQFNSFLSWQQLRAPKKSVKWHQSTYRGTHNTSKQGKTQLKCLESWKRKKP